MKRSEKIFGLLILLLPIQLGKHFWPDFSLVYGLRIDYLSPTVYLTDILIFLTLFFWFIEERPKIKISFWVVFGFFCLFLGIIFSGNIGSGFYKLIKLLEFTLLGYYVLNVKSSISSLSKFLPWVLVFTSLLAIVQFCLQRSVGGWLWLLGERPLSTVISGIALENLDGNLFLRPYATFSHPNSLAGFLLVGLILTLLKFKKTKYFWGYLGLILWAIVLSFSYSVWLVGTILLGLYIFLRKRKRFLLITIFFGVCLFLFCGFQFQSQSVTERWQLMMASFSMIKENLLFGVGLNNFIPKVSFYWIPTAYRLWQPVHNLYLLILAETGIVVFTLVSLFVVYTLKKLIVNKNVPLLLSFLAVLFLGLFDHYWLTLQQNQILLAILLGLSWRKNLSKELQ